MKLFKNILYKVFELQEKFLRLKLSRTIGAKNTCKIKRVFSKGCSLELGMMADIEKQRLEEEITLILQKYEYNPEKLLKYIKKQGTKVFCTKQAVQILNPIGENEGFVLPAFGSKAIYLSLSLEKKLKFKTEEMFILSPGKINKYYMIYHFYNWYAFKQGIEGIDRTSHDMLTKYLFGNADTKELQLADIYKLKDAIKQDKASIEFVINLCKKYDGAKNALQKIQTDGSANI